MGNAFNRKRRPGQATRPDLTSTIREIIQLGLLFGAASYASTTAVGGFGGFGG